MKFCHLNNSKGKYLTDLFRMNLSRAINKLESLDKIVKSSKFILQSQVST